jgi:hypothetical protein
MVAPVHLASTLDRTHPGPARPFLDDTPAIPSAFEIDLEISGKRNLSLYDRFPCERETKPPQLSSSLSISHALEHVVPSFAQACRVIGMTTRLGLFNQGVTHRAAVMDLAQKRDGK